MPVATTIVGGGNLQQQKVIRDSPNQPVLLRCFESDDVALLRHIEKQNIKAEKWREWMRHHDRRFVAKSGPEALILMDLLPCLLLKVIQV